MELTAASASAFQAAQLGQQAAVLVQRKSMDAAEQQGEAALKLLEQAAAIARSAPGGATRGIDVIA
ncbi:MAG: putative motility protein [Planctomycetes bacterium]|nr:putative motility protein [Planctomycetota bacterium]